MKEPKTARKITALSATALVVANMIGVGAFTTLGLQLVQVHHPTSIVLLWTMGGVISLLGALSYAEVGSRLPRSGGEYHFLRQIYHPFVGYLSGWVSLTVGFSASIALAAMAMGSYLHRFVGVSPGVIAAAAIVVASLVHSISLRQSSRFQNVITLVKMVVLVGFVVTGLTYGAEPTATDPAPWWKETLRTPFAISLVYVTYAFSGWNAAAYIVGEIKQPRRNLPRALIGGTLLVSVMYVLLQWGFMRQVPLSDLAGKVEVGQIVAQSLFGAQGGQLASFVIAFLLISSISAMVWVGPRVVRAMAEDYSLWRFLARDNRHGIPVRSIWLQSGISLFLIATSTFEQVLVYSGFILQLITTLTVAGVLILRKQHGAPRTGYRSWGYPWTQYAYLLVSGWILVVLLWEQPYQSLLGLGNLALGALSFWWSKKHDQLAQRREQSL